MCFICNSMLTYSKLILQAIELICGHALSALQTITAKNVWSISGNRLRLTSVDLKRRLGFNSTCMWSCLRNKSSNFTYKLKNNISTYNIYRTVWHFSPKLFGAFISCWPILRLSLLFYLSFLSKFTLKFCFMLIYI